MTSTPRPDDGPGVRRRFTATGPHGPLRGIEYPNGTVTFRWEHQDPRQLSPGAPDMSTLVHVHHIAPDSITYQEPAEPGPARGFTASGRHGPLVGAEYPDGHVLYYHRRKGATGTDPQFSHDMDSLIRAEGIDPAMIDYADQP